VRPIASLSLALLAACAGTSEDSGSLVPRGTAPEFSPPEPQVKRLTESQYLNSIADIFSDQISLTTQLDPLEESGGLYAIGAGVSTISPLGVERFETAAYQVAEQSMDDADIRAQLVPCEPEAVRDDACAEQVLETLGNQVWRRPLSVDELATLTELVGGAAEVQDDFYGGLEYSIAALLQSPHFLYRVDLGEEDGEGGYRYTDYEMASRLSYFLWNTTPDAELLEAAANGELTTDAGLELQVDRLLEAERARKGMRAFFTDMLDLHELDDLTKDPLIFLYMSDELGESAREETLVGLEQLVFEDEGDFRDLFTIQDVWIDRRLASIYNVPAPSMDGFAWTTLPDSDRRRGFLGQVSFLALQAHAVSTSVTLRGAFVQESLLCHSVPLPPADLNSAIPEVTEEAQTMRERVSIHLEDPACAGCHEITDPIGLGLENFDGIGRWRTSENGFAIDATGELDGETWTDAWDLGLVISDHPDLGPCLSKTLLGYAGGHSIDQDQLELKNWHAKGFEESGYRVLWLMRDIALSPGFRQAGEINP
jgi:hypothetical protein